VPHERDQTQAPPPPRRTNRTPYAYHAVGASTRNSIARIQQGNAAHTVSSKLGTHLCVSGNKCESAVERSTRNSIRQHTSAYVKHTTAYVKCESAVGRSTRNSIRQHTSAYVSIRQHTSAYVSIRQHTSNANLQSDAALSTAYVSIRQHTSAYVSIHQHTSAYVKCESAVGRSTLNSIAHIQQKATLLARACVSQ
jgi:isocitrate/isopropylmalate dehydrogenase